MTVQPVVPGDEAPLTALGSPKLITITPGLKVHLVHYGETKNKLVISENYAVLANTFHLNLISHWTETIIISNISCTFSLSVNEKHGEYPEPLHPDQIPVVVQHLHPVSHTSFSRELHNVILYFR